MIENIKGVRNPLTIIAIFAGLAEISGTVVLPLISDQVQGTYVWFLMLFPLLLVLLFFLTLNFNAKVLYSPSDFRDEGNYMKIFQPGSTAQKILKFQDEISEAQEIENPSETKPITGREQKVFKSKADVIAFMSESPRARYQLAEGLVIDRLAKEMKSPPQRDLSLRSRDRAFMFDAVFEKHDGLIVVEVKYFQRPHPISKIRETILVIQDVIQNMPKSVRAKTHILLAIVYDMPEMVANKFKLNIESLASDFSVNVQVRMFAFNDLLKELDTTKGVQNE